MKTKNLITKSLLVITAAALLFTACKKKEEDDKDTNGASENALAEGTYNDVSNIADEAGTSGSVTSYKQPGYDGLLTACATVTNDTISTPHRLTIDFGSANCLCADGRYRRGQILVDYSGKYKDSASTHTISFNNYFVNDNQVAGSKTVTNQGHITNGNLTWSINVNGQIILANGGGTITWTSVRTRVMTAGESTGVWADDMYSITGSASGTGASGNTFTAQITSPLIRNMAIGCRQHFVQGGVDFTPSNKPLRHIDYGSGLCDNVATVTIGSNTYTIYLQ